MVGNQADRNDYNISSSQSAQSNFETAASRLEEALARRDKDVANAMAAYEADGVSERYREMEGKWNTAGAEVRTIIQAIRKSLANNDDVASRAMYRAASFIP